MLLLYYIITEGSSSITILNSTLAHMAANGTNSDNGEDEDEESECPEEALAIVDMCYLHTYDTPVKKARVLGEAILVVWSIVYLAIAVREFTFLGYKIFLQNMALCPSRVLFLFGCILLIFTVPFRLACQPGIEDNLAVLCMLTNSLYFLFFCR